MESLGSGLEFGCNCVCEYGDFHKLPCSRRLGFSLGLVTVREVTESRCVKLGVEV